MRNGWRSLVVAFSVFPLLVACQQHLVAPPVGRELDQGTAALVEQVDAKRLAAAVQRYSLSQLKEEPTLTADQLRWVVAIEDMLVEADGIYLRARITLFLSDRNVGDRREEFRKLAFSEFINTFAAAAKAHDKASRDLDTLLTRVEVQKRAGHGAAKSAPDNSTLAPKETR